VPSFRKNNYSVVHLVVSGDYLVQPGKVCRLVSVEFIITLVRGVFTLVSYMMTVSLPSVSEVEILSTGTSIHSSPSLSLQNFAAPWKQAVVVPVFKNGNSALVAIIFLFIFLTVSQNRLKWTRVAYFKLKLNFCYHEFVKSKSTVTNLVTYLDHIFAVVTSQRQMGAIYFDLKHCILPCCALYSP
jgi:hypothetical protein